MKNLFAIILLTICCLSLCACGGSVDNIETVEDKVMEAVQAQINARTVWRYGGLPHASQFIDEIGENKFKVTGEISVRDKNGDTYEGGYDAVVEYDPATDECVVDIDIDSLYRK
ncbi:MAG: hypothetical protein IIX54_07005 [Clostridia bacterium]|nr:hypothetical protein [Clostridia bacterium]